MVLRPIPSRSAASTRLPRDEESASFIKIVSTSPMTEVHRSVSFEAKRPLASKICHVDEEAGVWLYSEACPFRSCIPRSTVRTFETSNGAESSFLRRSAGKSSTRTSCAGAITSNQRQRFSSSQGTSAARSHAVLRASAPSVQVRAPARHALRNEASEARYPPYALLGAEAEGE